MLLKIKNLILILLFFSLTSPLCAATTIESSTPEKVAQLNQQIKQLQDVIDQNKSQQNKINSSFEKNVKTSLQLKKQLSSLNKELHEKQSNLLTLQKNQQTQQINLDAQNQLLHQEIRAAYFLFCDDAQHDKLLNYFSYLKDACLQTIKQDSQTIADLKSKQSSVSNEKTHLLSTLIHQKNNQHQLVLTQKNQEEQLNQLNEQFQQNRKQLDNLLADKKALSDLIAHLSKKENEKPVQVLSSFSGLPFAQLKGKLPWPVKGKIIHHYGTPIQGSEIKYSGILIKTPDNEPVRAVSNGRVIFAGYLKGLGLLLIVDQGQGYLTLYGHNQVLYKQAGNIVKAGDLLATVGKGGEIAGSGLYFEIRHHEKPLNPENWC